MIAKLKFNLDNPDEREAHLRCIKSLDLACVIFDFSKNSRKKLEQKLDIEDISVLDEVFKEFNSILEENYINIDELIS